MDLPLVMILPSLAGTIGLLGFEQANAVYGARAPEVEITPRPIARNGGVAPQPPANMRATSFIRIVVSAALTTGHVAKAPPGVTGREERMNQEITKHSSATRVSANELVFHQA
jgi:hypothetical protein